MGRKKYNAEELAKRNLLTFYSYVMPIPESGCWIWMGAINKETGYGMLRANRKTTLAHRYIWSVENGEIPEGMFVCHKCDIRECVNPSHLFLGTQKDNMRDMMRKGRANPGHPKGEIQGSSKLTEIQVKEIIEQLNNNIKYPILAEKYSVSIQTIWRIKHAKQHGGWAHVPR